MPRFGTTLAPSGAFVVKQAVVHISTTKAVCSLDKQNRGYTMDGRGESRGERQRTKTPDWLQLDLRRRADSLPPLGAPHAEAIIRLSRSTMKNWIIGIGTFAIIFAVMIRPIQASVNKSEMGECYKWQDQAEQYSDLFFLTQWQADQCKAHGIVINAPVR